MELNYSKSFQNTNTALTITASSVSKSHLPFAVCADTSPFVMVRGQVPTRRRESNQQPRALVAYLS